MYRQILILIKKTYYKRMFRYTKCVDIVGVYAENVIIANWIKMMFDVVATLTLACSGYPYRNFL